MKFIEVYKKNGHRVDCRSLINVKHIIAVREGRNEENVMVTFIDTSDGRTIETDIRYSDVVALIKSALEAVT